MFLNSSYIIMIREVVHKYEINVSQNYCPNLLKFLFLAECSKPPLGL